MFDREIQYIDDDPEPRVAGAAGGTGAAAGFASQFRRMQRSFIDGTKGTVSSVTGTVNEAKSSVDEIHGTLDTTKESHKAVQEMMTGSKHKWDEQKNVFSDTKKTFMDTFGWGKQQNNHADSQNNNQENVQYAAQNNNQNVNPNAARPRGQKPNDAGAQNQYTQQSQGANDQYALTNANDTKNNERDYSGEICSDLQMIQYILWGILAVLVLLFIFVIYQHFAYPSAPVIVASN